MRCGVQAQACATKAKPTIVGVRKLGASDTCLSLLCGRACCASASLSDAGPGNLPSKLILPQDCASIVQCDEGAKFVVKSFEVSIPTYNALAPTALIRPYEINERSKHHFSEHQ